jgi:hypothetical protein
MPTKRLTSKDRRRRRPTSRPGKRQEAPQGAAGSGARGEGIDMVQAIGSDFGCVKSGDTRAVGEKLADFGRAQHR